MYCSNCGMEIGIEGNFCERCGTPKDKKDVTRFETNEEHKQNTEPSEPAQNNSQEELALFVGNKSEYYMRKWGNVETPKNSWNWAAFFVSLFWLGYRKMYVYAFGILGFFLAIDIIVYYMNWDSTSFDSIGSAVAFVVGFHGNRSYFNHAKNKIQFVKNRGFLPDQERREITVNGGTSWKGVILVILASIIYALVNVTFFDPDNASLSNGVSPSTDIGILSNETIYEVSNEKLASPQNETWNMNDSDASTNGNIQRTIKILDSSANSIENAQYLYGSEVNRAPWKYYGQLVALEGMVFIIQEYPPSESIVQEFGGSLTEIVLVDEEEVIIDFLYAGNSDYLMEGDYIIVYGFPVGYVNVENKLGGITQQLLLVGDTWTEYPY